jgi:hypothetical protein
VKSTTFIFKVGGDSYEELIKKAEITISRFTNSVDDEDFDDEIVGSKFDVKVNYELIVNKSENISSENEYEAEVVAKIRDTK